MGALDDWPAAPMLQTARLSLEPLRVDHAEEMTSVLDDPRLFAFTGGSPCTIDELRDRYRRQVTGWSPDRRARWLNWIVRERGTGQAVGTTQATITIDGDAVSGELAWVVGCRHQRRGYAREAAGRTASWLREQGALSLFAEIHPQHVASMNVARHLGLKPNHEILESGETRWSDHDAETGSAAM
ncbi:MAG: hypothetical protein QOJ89_4546 [bacterium]|jgi:RimJ/RimL family protein N-acetyltransferase